MPCSKARRERQRERRRQKRRAATLPRRNEFGVLDLTPHNATRRDGEIAWR